MSAVGVVQAFAPRYAQARARFLEAAATAGLPVQSHPHPLPGSEGEALALDVVRDGPPDADKLLIVSSACHGVEGFCGSGAQVYALHDQEWRAAAHAQGVAVLYLHALNPYGFSHLRRVTHENVDLNRNFQDFGQPLPINEAYAAIAHLVIPGTWPPDAANQAAVQQYLATHGESAWQAAISRGQHAYPQGLFFGGTEPTWSHRTLRQVLRAHGGAARRIGWIDLHTGLGPSGHGERIYAGRDDASAVARARRWWDGGGSTPVTSIYDGSSTSAFLTGLMWNAIYDECPQAEFTGIALEYGTVPIMEVIEALRAEQWLQLHPEADAALAAQLKARMRNAFYTDTDTWKGQVIAQARQALFQAVQGLGS